ncbi:GFA family protein [Limoniibacter endophyticus]|nr:GFA family protein [Limoniibacter endophyticus]
MIDAEKFSGQCHCGSVRFNVRLSDGLKTARRCTCSYCRMRGAVAVSARLADLEVIEGQDKLTLYTFNTGTAKHHFCSVCGIYVFHQRRSNPEEYGINAACLDDISPFDFACIPVFDGVNHPKDVPGRSGLVGTLEFHPREGETPPARMSKD